MAGGHRSAERAVSSQSADVHDPASIRDRELVGSPGRVDRSGSLYVSGFEDGVVWRSASPTVLPFNTSRPTLARSGSTLSCRAREMARRGPLFLRLARERHSEQSCQAQAGRGQRPQATPCELQRDRVQRLGRDDRLERSAARALKRPRAYRAVRCAGGQYPCRRAASRVDRRSRRIAPSARRLSSVSRPQRARHTRRREWRP